MAIRIAIFSNAGFFAPVCVLFSPFDGSKTLQPFDQKTFGFYKLNRRLQLILYNTKCYVTCTTGNT